MKYTIAVFNLISGPETATDLDFTHKRIEYSSALQTYNKYTYNTWHSHLIIHVSTGPKCRMNNSHTMDDFKQSMNLNGE